MLILARTVQRGLMINKVSYSESFLTFEEQVQLLESRGLLIGTDENRAFMVNFLKNLNFYRFDGYCRRYYDENSKKHRFISNASFMKIQDDYYADKQIRLVTFEIIQDFEISLRSQFVDVLGSKYGIYPYKQEYYHTNNEEWKKLYKDHFLKAVNNSNEAYIKNFLRNYSDALPPIWMMVELLSLGELSKIYMVYLKDEDRNEIANRYMLSATAMESWIHSLSVLRNKCALHAKLIDTSSTVPVIIPRRWKIDRYGSLMQTMNPRSLCILILTLCYLSEAMGRKGFAAKYIMKIENIMKTHGLDDTQIGLPEGLTISNIKNELGFEAYRIFC